MSEMHETSAPKPLDPFHPSPGEMPEHLAGRERELGILQRVIDRLADGRKASSNIILTAPRGFGKTTLLNAAANMAQDANARDKSSDEAGCKKIRSILTNTSELTSIRQLIQMTLGRKAGAVVTQESGTSVGGEAGFHALGFKAGGQGGRTNAQTVRQAPLELHAWVSAWAKKCGKRPTLLLLDEGHRLHTGRLVDGEEVGNVAGALFNAVQSIRNSGSPLCLVIAGTPDMKDNLGKAGATFWSRCAPSHILDLPSLSPQAACDALEKPLELMGLTADADALQRMVDDAQGYPHFLQMWGHAAHEALVAAGGDRLTVEHVESARPLLNRAKGELYGQQYQEIRGAQIEGHSLLPGFGALCAAISEAHGGRVLEDDLERALEASLPQELQGAAQIEATEAVMRKARHTGLARVRLDADGHAWWTPAIPSMLDYIKGRVVRRNPAGAEAPRALHSNRVPAGTGGAS